MPHSRTVAVVATTLASVLSRAASLVSQVIVGMFLTEAQVGEYALAIGVIGVTAIWRNGGAATYFPSVKHEDFDLRAGSLFAWSTAFGALTATITTVVAFVMHLAPETFPSYQSRTMLVMLLLLAARAGIHPLALLGRMRLTVQLSFTGLARLDAVLAVLRVGLTWMVAREGGGALALAVPYAASTLAEALAVGLMGGFRRADFVPSSWNLRALWPALAWPLAMAVLGSIRGEVSFLIVGLLIPSAALGVFFFAFQLASQPTMMIGGALQNVLAPMLARDRGSRDAERLGVERVLASAMLFVPVTTMAAASFFPPAERLLWNGKWTSATSSLYFLCAAATYSTVAALLVGPLVGLQRFRAAAGFEFLKMAGMLVGVAAGAILTLFLPSVNFGGVSQVTIISACVSIGTGISALAQVVWVAHAYRLGRSETIRNLLFGPALSALTAISATSLASSLTNSIGITHDRQGALWELIAVATTYVTLITLAVRFTAESTLRDTLRALPRPVADPIRRLLHLT